jgi:hypothetical protein
MALPREGREVSKSNDLEKGLGREYAIEVHSVSVATPKPFADYSTLHSSIGSVARARREITSPEKILST